MCMTVCTRRSFLPPGDGASKIFVNPVSLLLFGIHIGGCSEKEGQERNTLASAVPEMMFKSFKNITKSI